MKIPLLILYISLAGFSLSCTPHTPEKNLTEDDKSNEPTSESPVHKKDYRVASSQTTSIANLNELKQKLSLGFFYNNDYRCQNSRIAVLDNGYQGLEDEKGSTLPENIIIEPAPGNEPSPTIHGTRMAQIIYALCTGSENYNSKTAGPKILLYNTNGFTNLKHAISEVIKRKVDIVLYSQGWTFGGNFDGTGFINKEVNRATDHGIIWVNAAGNFNQTTFVSEGLTTNEDGSVKLPHNEKYLKFTHQYEDLPLTITLSWNDFTDSESYKTNQDLDLFVENLNGVVVASSEKKQLGEQASGNENNFSAHARELLVANLASGQYLLRIKNASNNFRSDSRFRVIFSTYGLKLEDSTPARTVLIPADNPSVISVGSASGEFSAKGYISSLYSKPEIESYSRVIFNDGASYESTSTAAAIVAAQFALYRTTYGQLSKTQAMKVYNILHNYRTLKNIKLPRISANTDTK